MIGKNIAPNLIAIIIVSVILYMIVSFMMETPNIGFWTLGGQIVFFVILAVILIHFIGEMAKENSNKKDADMLKKRLMDAIERDKEKKE